MNPSVRRTHSLFLALMLSVVADAMAQTSTEPKRGAEIETPDYALRRAQALHDMYAGPEELAAHAQAERVHAAAARAAERGGAPSKRPLPIHYPSLDTQARLDAVKQIVGRPVAPGSTYRAMVARPSAIAGSAWTNIGPTNAAGRVSALAVDPSDAKVLYRGTAGGGVWKSVDAGKTWTALTDSLGNLSIGAVAVAPSNPKIVYVGTGEGALGIDGIDGIGIIRSSDAGATWSLPVSVAAAKFFALNVHPTNPNEVLAATSKGLLKSSDGAKTWKTVLLANAYVTEVVRVPNSPNKLLATVWDVATTAGTGQGSIHRSADGGESWTKVGGAGIAPFDPDAGRMALAIAPSAPGTIYVLAASVSGNIKSCQTDAVDQVGIYRSTDGGNTWTFRANPATGNCPVAEGDEGYDSILGGQGWYAITLRVAPGLPNTLYAGGLDFWKSTDGGLTWKKKTKWDNDEGDPHYVHADIHALVFAGSNLLVGNDGGVSVTSDAGTTFKQLNSGIATRQYYSIGVSKVNRDLVIGGAQDNGTNVRKAATTDYVEKIGGDGFAVAVHPNDPNILYGTVYESRIFRSKDGGVHFAEVTPKYANNENRPFISPLTIDGTNPLVLYTGTNLLWKTLDGGSTWSRVSNTDMGDGSRRGYITKIAVARSDSKRILVGTGSGTVSKSTDGGASWTRLQGLPSRFVSHVEFDPVNADIFYVSYTSMNPGSRILRTTNGGTSFTPVETGLPTFPVHVVRVDPTDSKALYAGTDVGLYRSLDSGGSWNRFGTDLPAVSIWDIAILPDGSMMRIATHGRGFFELHIP